MDKKRYRKPAIVRINSLWDVLQVLSYSEKSFYLSIKAGKIYPLIEVK